MKKFIIAIIIAAGIVGLVMLFRFKTKSPAATTDASAGTNSTPATSSSSTSTTSTPTTLKDGSYTGTAVDNGYGIVQIEAVVSGGKITDIKFLQMPSGGHSSEVAAFAEPQLKTEALQAQSANVNIVSGATQDSQAFAQSLQAALSKAS